MLRKGHLMISVEMRTQALAALGATTSANQS
jgi:hypothetical protein